MEITKKEENITIIRKTYKIIKERYAIHGNSIHSVNFKNINISDEECEKINCKLQTIRQDFTKILIMMNRIEKIYSEYQNETYKANYTSAIGNEAEEELGCIIEYLFSKYRVIIEYIFQILEILIPIKFNEKESLEYLKLKKWHKKHRFLIKYLQNKIGNKDNLINMEWFQQIRVDRDFIIHDGATCLVFGDKKELLFKVMTTGALDKEEEIQDDFFSTNNNLIKYTYFWGLKISKLIIFCETIFDFLSDNFEVENENMYFFEKFFKKQSLISSDGEELSGLQDVLLRILEKIISSEDK